MGRFILSVAGCLLVAAGSSAAESPAGWKLLKDKDGACHVSVPPDWTVNEQLPSMAMAPDRSDANVTWQIGKSVKPLPDIVQTALGVGRMIENTPQRIFWVGKPASYQGGPQMVSYHVSVPVRGGVCEARIALKAGASDDVAKRIAGTLGAGH